MPLPADIECCDCLCPIDINDLPDPVVIGTIPEYTTGWAEALFCCWVRTWHATGASEENNDSQWILTPTLQSHTRNTFSELEYLAWEKPFRQKLCVVAGNYYEPWPLLVDGPTEAHAKSECPKKPDSDILDRICPINRKQVSRSTVTYFSVNKMRLEMYYRVLQITLKISKVTIASVSKWAVAIHVRVRYRIAKSPISRTEKTTYKINNLPNCYFLDPGNPAQTESTVNENTGPADYPDPVGLVVPIGTPFSTPPSGWTDGWIRKVKLYTTLPTSIDFDALVSITQEEYMELHAVAPMCYPLSENPKEDICALVTEGWPFFSNEVCEAFTIPEQEKDFNVLNNNLVAGSTLHSVALNYTYYIVANCNFGVSSQYTWSHTFSSGFCNTYADYTIRPNIVGSSIQTSSPVVTQDITFPFHASCISTDPCVWPSSALHIFDPPGPVGTPTEARYYTVTDDTVTSATCYAGYVPPACPDIIKDQVHAVNVLSASQSCINVPFSPTEVCITETFLPLIEF